MLGAANDLQYIPRLPRSTSRWGRELTLARCQRTNLSNALLAALCSITHARTLSTQVRQRGRVR